MTPHIKRLATAFAISAVMVSLVGCQKPEGPAQKAGKAIDQGAAKAGQAIQNAGNSIQKTAKGNP
ncbi:MAG: hypothetical protein ACYCSR_13920 [Thiomonas sp.]|uniref:Uncharacterized protein n=1 Tax=mine drainage metagenome TaxID=410659 RepID=E6PJR6_9ZZZZ